LHEVGRGAGLTHADLIREGYVIFLCGPQANINRLGTYYALHILAFCDALYNGAGALRAICDEFTNTPLKSLVESLTTLRAYGAEIHMIAQSRSEIIRRFGEQETRTIEDNSIVKQWFGFSSIEEARRASDAIGDQHAVSSALSGQDAPQLNLSLTKQRWYSPAELMAMPREEQLVWIKGIGFFTCRTIAQNEIAPFSARIAPNPLEGGRLPSKPKMTLATPKARP
jgi:type IV secretion system protein VirD4